MLPRDRRQAISVCGGAPVNLVGVEAGSSAVPGKLGQSIPLIQVGLSLPERDYAPTVVAHFSCIYNTNPSQLRQGFPGSSPRDAAQSIRTGGIRELCGLFRCSIEGHATFCFRLWGEGAMDLVSGERSPALVYLLIRILLGETQPAC